MKRERFIWGVFLIAAAVLIIVAKLGVLHNIGVFNILLSIVFIAMLIRSLVSRSVTGVLFSAAFLAIVNDELLGITAITPWIVLLAALLGSIGFGLLFGSKKKHGKQKNDFKETVEGINGNKLNFDIKFGSSIKYIDSDDFRNATLTCHFGGMKVYFDNVKVGEGVPVIDVDVSFGGVEIYIPRDWKIINKTRASFGGIEEKNAEISNNLTMVDLTGNISFAGVTIVYV